ncbi:Organic solute transporter Ost-alpha [Quillaja saponaria]|uniref:Organic solute transporter Ost-alpha n=1 Tax=Quillaja saponaria TaxID=32244 RepID=A0AAD7PCC6_QUISA|nr:Organic solute transporter Ost-alpha [Quillaja saponaria]
MDQRVEQIEKNMVSLISGQAEIKNDIMNRMNELFGELGAKMESLSAYDEAEISTAQPRGRRYNNTFLNSKMKLDFPRYNGEADPTSWLCRAEQFFLLYETAVMECIAIASFHLENDAQLWYQILK